MTDVQNTSPTTASPDNGYRSIWGHLMRTPFRQDWIDAGGVRTRYAQAGRPDAPVLIMVHGTGGSWEGFCATMEAHAEKFNCIAYDAIGAGFTDKPDKDYFIADYVAHLHALMNALGLSKASVLGVSLGSWIATRFALQYPAMIDKLILLAPVGLATVVPPASTGSTVRTRRMDAVTDPSWANVKKVIDGLMVNEASRIADLVKIRQAIFLQPEMRQAMGHILALINPEQFPSNAFSEEEWRGMKAPTLIIDATGDQELYRNTGRRLASLRSSVTVAQMQDVGHWAHFEKPDLFNDISLQFLQR